MRRALPWLVILATACSGTVGSVLTPDLDVALARRQAREMLGDPLQRGQGHQRLGWLCLLHGDGCAELPEHARLLDPTDPQGALLRALALQGQADVAPRAQAWLAVLEQGLAMHSAQGDTLMTLGAEALSRLAVRDRHAVVQQLSPAAWTSLTVGAPEQRWRRTLALGPLLAARPTEHKPWHPELLRTPLQVVARVEPVSRRLHTGLRALGEAVPQALDLSLQPTRSSQELVPLPLASAWLPEPLQTGRYLLPARDPGVYLLRAQFEGGGKLLVLVRAPRGLKLWLDGQPLADSAAGSGRERLVRAQIDATPGPHRLDLAVALAGNAETLDLDVLRQGDASPADLLADWPEALRDLALALLEPEGPARIRLARQFSKGPAAALVSVDSAASLDAEHTAVASVLDRLLEAMPWHLDAQVDRVAKVREAGNPALAWQMLRQVGERPGPRLPIDTGEVLRVPAGGRADVALERANVLLALGLNDEAAQAALQAARLQPDDCDVFEHALTLGMDALDRPLLRQLLARTPHCPERALPVAMAQASIGELETARKTLTLAQEQPAHARQAHERLVAMADAGGEAPPPVPAWLADVTTATWRAAQQAELKHDHAQARLALGKLLTAPGHPLEARQRALQAGAAVPWLAFERAGEALALEPDDPALVQGASTAWLLDQEIVLLLPGGGALRRVHQIVRVLKDEAAEAVGEVRVAEGADLEFARTLLPDGTVVLPAETADKETISLRAVEAGTAVEFAQIAYVPPDDPASGATRLPPFVLQASDGPTRLTEYVVLVPKGVQARFEVSPPSPAVEIRQLPGYEVHVWRRQNVPRFRNEPRSVRPDLALPSVRTTAHADLDAVLGPWNETLAAWLDLRDDDLERWVEVARKLPAATRWQTLATRLSQAIQQLHEGGAPGRPDSAIQNGKGDRAAVLYTLARRLGEDACLVRALPLARLPGRDPPDPEDYGLELVRIHQPSGDVWYDPGLEGGLLNHLRAGLRGRSGLLAGCATAPEDPHVTLPRLGDGQDRRHIALELQWQADGRVLATVHDTLQGALAALVRTWMIGATDASRTEMLAQLTGTSFAGWTLTWQDVQGLGDAPGAPLTLVYQAIGAADPTRANTLEVPLYPDQLGQAYAGLADRRTRLLFSHSLDTTLDVSLHSDKPLATLPPAVDVQHALVEYHRSAELRAGVLHLHKTLVARPAVVESRDYPLLARDLRAIDAAETVRLER
jgi:hypothetical protein